MVAKLEDKPLVSFVLPAYNEGKSIERALERLDSSVNGSGLRYEVVVVDDGSVDDTRLKVLNYAAQSWNVRVFGYDRNVGKGFAVKSGFWKSVGDAVVFVDSDSDIDVGQFRRYVDALADADIVVGSKWHRDSVVEVSFVRGFLSRGFNVLVRLLTGVRVSDTQAGIKAVRREAFCEVFRRLSVKRYAFDVELLVLAGVFGLRVVELPVKLKLSSRFGFGEIWRMLLDLLGIAYRLRIKKWYQRSA
jgi:glycosyltransferase involved in cell wall biosynthesis